MSKKTIFISHAGPQAPLAFAVDQLLTEAGHNTIVYERDFPKDSDFVDEIADALVVADFVVCLVSEAFVTSNWCVKEYLVADSASKLIPFIVEKCDVSGLPASIKGATSLHGLSPERAATKVGKELEQLVPTLHSQRLATKQVRKTVEQALLIFPLFEGGHEAGRWQDHAVAYTQTLFRDENILIKALPEYVRSEKEARNLLRRHNADIVIYGKFRSGEVEMGFVSSRGWNMTAGRDDVKVPSDLRFKARREHFRDLTLILKLAFGNLEAGRNRHKRAITHFSEALGQGIAPERAREYGMQYLYHYWGSQLNRLAKFEDAVVVLSRAIEIAPKFAPAWHSRAFALEKLGRYVESLVDNNEAIRLNPDNATSLFNRGYLYVQLESYEKAVNDYNRVIRMTPNDTDAWHNRGWALMHLGRYSQAVSDFNEALKLDPKHVISLSQRGYSFGKLGDTNKALIDLNMALTLQPKDRYALTVRASVHAKFGNEQKALDDSNEAIRLYPKDSEAWHGRSYVHRLLGRFHLAIADGLKAVHLDPTLKKAWANMGWCHFKRNEWCKALACFRKYAQLGGSEQQVLKQIPVLEEKCLQ